MEVKKTKEKNINEFLCIYITDALQCISKNTAIYKGNSYMEKRYYDCVNPNTQKPKPIKTGDEIIAETIAKSGLHKAE